MVSPLMKTYGKYSFHHSKVGWDGDIHNVMDDQFLATKVEKQVTLMAAPQENSILKQTILGKAELIALL